MDKWIEAAQAFRAAKGHQGKKASVKKRQSDLQADIARCARRLEQFLESDKGLAALELLKASRRHINFAEDYDGGGYGIVFAITGDGLQQSVEAMGTWMLYAKPKDVRKPHLSPISALEAIEAAVHHGKKDPAEIMVWLEGELDTIAESAPSIS